MANANDVYRIYAQIVNGDSKEESIVDLDDELSQLWDDISAEVAEAKASKPNVVFDIPNEVPDVEPQF